VPWGRKATPNLETWPHIPFPPENPNNFRKSPSPSFHLQLEQKSLQNAFPIPPPRPHNGIRIPPPPPPSNNQHPLQIHLPRHRRRKHSHPPQRPTPNNIHGRRPTLHHRPLHKNRLQTTHHFHGRYILFRHHGTDTRCIRRRYREVCGREKYTW